MGLTTKDNGGGQDFKKVPPGAHAARCNMVVDLGYQETTYNGEAKIQSKVFIRWEIPGQRVEYKDRDGNKQEGPMVIGSIYTQSLSKKAYLRRDLENWRGKPFSKKELEVEGFDIGKLIGAPCLLTVTHNDTGEQVWANVTGIAPLPKEMVCGPAELPTLLFDIDDPINIEDVPEWLVTKYINKAVYREETASPTEPETGPELDDEIPF